MSAEHSWDYDDDQAIPDYALPRFQGNPKNNYQVMSPVPEYLRGYWMKAHQSPRWEGDGKGDIRSQEGRLQEIIKGYAALATRCMTTYEYKAPSGLNHGLSMLHDEITQYIVPPMVIHASALLGDFVVLCQKRQFHHSWSSMPWKPRTRRMPRPISCGPSCRDCVRRSSGPISTESGCRSRCG